MATTRAGLAREIGVDVSTIRKALKGNGSKMVKGGWIITKAEVEMAGRSRRK